VLPAATIEEAGVHAVEVCGKQRSLISAGAWADFDDRRTIVERIRRNEKRFQLTLELLDGLLCPRDFGTRLSGELCVVNDNELARLRELVIEFL
jgi:hypothetical protein